METKVDNAIISFNPNTTLNQNPQRPKNIFKVALFMMRGNSRKSSKAIVPVDDESKGIWRNLIGSMRPMHLQSHQSPPQILNGQNNLKNINVIDETANDHQGEEDGVVLASESPPSSRYASAVGLNEMVEEEEKEEEIVIKDFQNYGDDGDNMIDAKADEFIAQFYHEMKLQRMDVVDHRYNELSMRSLGL
ncbi:unnamed protein product [Lathyrus oleraceus]|uniref:Cotton fiber protein n=1 Tax=Pisum sativum TaxID=3888 RepID=A0A9D5A940_PEA|nr:uncharacterized protein LOC127092957 [Pisum sativum]KAI5399083.1 hypothetical protein KIW84_064452 [Pisum sativum]